ncbi:MAG: fibro-slime domain-containing protein [Nannocystales bacterium]
MNRASILCLVATLTAACDAPDSDSPDSLPTTTSVSSTGGADASTVSSSSGSAAPSGTETGIATSTSALPSGSDTTADSPVSFDVGTISDVGSVGPEACNDGTVTLTATVRDFASTHPDFESFWGGQPSLDLVESTLGADDLPVYNAAAPAPPAGSSPTQITSIDTFAQWYADLADVNVTAALDIELVETAPGSGLFVFDDDTFFPLDDAGWNGAPGPNNETFPDALGDQHNFHFTTEIHTTFVYEPGQVFTFVGDDDLWVFVDGARVIDLGGLHGELTGSIDLDTLGLTDGETYAMDIFHAERRHDGSHFRIETSIQCFSPPAG